jgi:hypothetical protein
MPGITAMAVDVLAADGSHPQKAGPCAGCAGSSEFLRLQSKLDHLPDRPKTRLAKDRAAETVSKVMIPEALDYPAWQETHEPPHSRLSLDYKRLIARRWKSTSPAPASARPWAAFSPRSRAPGAENPADPAFESKVAPGMPLQVLCYERADDLAAGVSGVVTRARAFAPAFPISIPLRFPWPPRSKARSAFLSARSHWRQPALRALAPWRFFLGLGKSGG